MADINKRLLTASDGIPAPQHKVKGASEFEFTEGSGGAQHTKIVDSSGQPISIDDELKSIKRTQAEILDRLDNGIDTRLTGSKVEISRSTVTVTQGSSYDIGTWEIPGFKEFYVSVTADTNHDYDLRQTQLHDTEGSNQQSLFVNDVIESGSSVVKYTKKPYLLIGRYLRINIRNNSSEDKVYDVRVWGIV